MLRSIDPIEDEDRITGNSINILSCCRCSGTDMTEFWVEANIIPKDKSVEEILLTAVKPIVDHFSKVIITWHFLRETTPIGKSQLRFRIRTRTKAQMKTIRNKIDKDLNPLKGNDIEDFYYGVHGTPESQTTDKYEGEEKDFGVKGWQIAQKLMEHTSDAVIEIIQKAPLDKPIEWLLKRCVHFFLNQVGCSRYDEASLHHKWSFENLLVVYGIPQLSNNLRLLEEKYHTRFPKDKPK